MNVTTTIPSSAEYTINIFTSRDIQRTTARDTTWSLSTFVFSSPSRISHFGNPSTLLGRESRRPHIRTPTHTRHSRLCLGEKRIEKEKKKDLPSQSFYYYCIREGPTVRVAAVAVYALYTSGTRTHTHLHRGPDYILCAPSAHTTRPAPFVFSSVVEEGDRVCCYCCSEPRRRWVRSEAPSTATTTSPWLPLRQHYVYGPCSAAALALEIFKLHEQFAQQSCRLDQFSSLVGHPRGLSTSHVAVLRVHSFHCCCCCCCCCCYCVDDTPAGK